MLLNAPPEKKKILFDAVSCICIHNGKILFLQRHLDKSYPLKWGLPTGKKNGGETDKQAMIRELFEETGVLKSSDQLELLDQYYIQNDDMCFRYVLFMSVFTEKPFVTIKRDEHVNYCWEKMPNAKLLELVPDLLECLVLSEKHLLEEEDQLELFGDDALPPVKKYSKIPNDEKVRSEFHFSESTLRASFTTQNCSLVFGPPGSGKTTAIKGICKQFHPRFSHQESKKILSQGTRLNTYLKKIFVEHDHNSFLAFQIEALTMRLDQYYSAPKNAILEQGLVSILAYSKALLRLGQLTEEEYDTFYSVFCYYQRSSPKLGKVIHLTANSKVLLQRIRSRGRKHEMSHYNSEYIDEIRRGMFEASEEFRDDINIILIDTSNLNKRQVLQELAHALGISN